jgi:aminopeptidase N
MKNILGWLTVTITLFSPFSFADNVDYRLPTNIKPTFQAIHLTIDPDAPDYQGSTSIDLNITENTTKIGFYQLDLGIDKAILMNGDVTIPLTVTTGDYDINWGVAQQVIKPGQYQLKIDFHGLVNTSSDGMYLSKFEGNNYIFTQFEDMHARRAFPSFDEPSFKIPYQMTITAPADLTVASNTPVEVSAKEDGMQTVRFMKTPPMPTYLIAYTVGPLDAAEITGLSVPGKIYVPKGYADKTKFVVEHTPEILASLEGFFGMDYPFKKLDFVAVPNFTHGAMENAGLVTFRSSLLLLADEPDLSERGSSLNTVAHELAHMWFGDLVTMAWWDDLWLNEAFASWTASYVMMELYPELNYKDRIIQEGAFNADASPTTKPVKKLVRIQPDVMDGLGLNYSKGESILQMIESLIGTDNFRKGVQAYMKKHAWGNTQDTDLWAALDAVADFNLSAMMRTYLEQPGYPLMTFAENGTVTQTRYHFAGAEVTPQRWAVPLNISYKKNGKIQHKLVFIDAKDTQLPELAEADWIFPNDNATGYFRWQIPQQQMTELLADINLLNSREKKNLLYNLDALLAAGKVPLEQVMLALDTLAKDADPIVVRATVSSLSSFLYLVNDANKADFAKLINRNFAPVLAKLSLQQGVNDNEARLRLRNTVYALLGKHGLDNKLIQQSEALAKDYLADTRSVPNGIAKTALSVTTKYASTAWFDKILEAYRVSDIPAIKNTLLYSMSFQDDMTIERMLDLAISDDVPPANTISMLRVGSRTIEDKTLFYRWLSQNMAAVTAKMPAYHIARMPELVSRHCSKENLALAQAFYPPYLLKFEGMARSYDVMLDSAEQCIALKDKNQQAFDDYLNRATK